MKKIVCLFFTFSALLVGIYSCKEQAFDKNKFGNCTNNIKDQNEEEKDCGGVCLPCSSCNDGIQNSNETGIDCGGSCISCAPPCTLTSATMNYTYFPQGFTSSTSNVSPVYSIGYYAINDRISVSFSGSSGGIFTYLNLELRNDFNPLNALAINQTMVLETLSYGSTISKDSQTIITFGGNFALSSFNGVMDGNQRVYVTKVSNTNLQVRFCNMKAGNNIFFLNAI
jgi:hypothetical protein